jgi:hypothetical protein
VDCEKKIMRVGVWKRQACRFPCLHMLIKTRPDSYTWWERIYEGKHGCRVTMTREYNGVWGDEEKSYKRMNDKLFPFLRRSLMLFSKPSLGGWNINVCWLFVGVCGCSKAWWLSRLIAWLHRVRFYDCGILSHTLTTEIIKKNKIT